MDKLSACRICGNEVSVTHCVTLFSRESLAAKTPEWLSRVAPVPVIQDNGLSHVIHLCHWKDEPMLPPAWASLVIPPSECKTEHTPLLHRVPYWYQATTTHCWKLKYTDRCINVFYWGVRLPRFWVMVSAWALLHEFLGFLQNPNHRAWTIDREVHIGGNRLIYGFRFTAYGLYFAGSVKPPVPLQ